MHILTLFVLFVVLWATPCWSEPDWGQSDHVPAAESSLLVIDESAFEIAAATGGFYYFWQPGEFARVAARDSIALFMPSSQTIAQFDGVLRGWLEIPFEVEAGHMEMIVRVGLQSPGEIELWSPGQATPYEGQASERTAHMLVVHAPEPRDGTWTVRLEGSGVYLVNATARQSVGPSEMVESEAGCEWMKEESGEPTREDLACFRSASSEARWDFFRRLPEPRRESLARSLLNDDEPLVAYIAAGSLARDGHLDEAVPVFARILVRGEGDTALEGRMGYDWIHDDDATLADRLLGALRHHLRSHIDDYSESERTRAESFLGD